MPPPQKHIARWGTVWAPQTLSGLVEVLDRENFSNVRPCSWRGQSKAEWTLESGAARRFVNSPIFAPARGDATRLEALIAGYERDLVEHARLAGHGYAEGRRISDLELLALLQHHGAATRLLDFLAGATKTLDIAVYDAHFDDE